MATRETSRRSGAERVPAGPAPYPDDQARPDAGVDARVDAGKSMAGTESIADPGPLGLAAFAATTFVLSVFNAHIVKDASLEAVVLPLALFYGGFAQLLAGMWEFKKANTFGATAFASFGAFWLAYWFLVRFTTFPSDVPGNSAEHAVATFLLGWTIFTAYMTVAA